MLPAGLERGCVQQQLAGPIPAAGKAEDVNRSARPGKPGERGDGLPQKRLVMSIK